MRMRAAIFLAAAVVGIAGSVWTFHRPPASMSTVIVGGSAAKGWFDQSGRGYIERALLSYGNAARVQFRIVNHAIPGARVLNPVVRRHFADWIPQGRGLVIIGWGLLNDVRRHTPPGRIGPIVHAEVGAALRARDVVLLVSPSATRSTFTIARHIQPAMWREEVQAAQSYQSPNVYVVNVMNPEKRWMLGHHVGYQAFMQGLWDPNTRGHQLASRILERRLEDTWHNRVPRFRGRNPLSWL